MAMAGTTPQLKDPYADLNAPNAEELSVQLQELVQQGTLSPEQAQAILVDKSKMEDVQQDPQARAAQQAALSQLQDITESGGLTAMDRSKLNQISMDEDTKARGGREAILQNMAQRGMGGSGVELLAQLQNQQDSVTRKNSRDLDVAAMAQQNALNALMNQGNLATQVGNQQFEQQAAKANAADAIAKFNAQNRQQVGLTNTAANNQAQASNLAAKQDIANQNTGLKNQQEMINKNLIQQQFENQLKKRGAQTGVNQFNATNAGADSQHQAEAFNKTAGGVFTALSMMSDERSKEDIKPFDAAEFLDSITPHKYRYKDPKNGEGERAGVMAQDLEKSDLGSQMVSESPEGKMVDYGKAAPTMLASLADIHRRLKDLEGE